MADYGTISTDYNKGTDASPDWTGSTISLSGTSGANEFRMALSAGSQAKSYYVTIGELQGIVPTSGILERRHQGRLVPGIDFSDGRPDRPGDERVGIAERLHEIRNRRRFMQSAAGDRRLTADRRVIIA